ncbi:MAG TPA: hypothetical protein VNV66_16040 [Pilimelia sp.]|nr:hypothetical protein [Pilimelia sp.]
MPWLPAPCASGRLESVTGAGGSAIIQAEVTLCGKWTSSYSFTLAVFRPRWERAIVTSGELKHYRPDGPTTASTNIVPPATGAIGVCLMRSESARLACLRLEADGAGGVTATSVPVDDPLVAYPVYYFQDNLPPPGGHCASCVTTGRT